ncbi:MAG: type III pantothenate kinase [Eubacteriales bacterium]|jgi:type III pantothenate kinase
MVLAIDIGNTNIVLGGIKDGEIRFVARLATDSLKTEDQYGVEIKNILQLYSINLTEIDGGIISSVVPPLSNILKSALSKIIHRPPLVVGPGVKTGLNILMDNPAQLGSDLVVNAVAGLAEYKPPLIIIDMGTATTISVVDEKGNYIGGGIYPGVRISLDALSGRAAQLPYISLENPRHAIGKNTIDCMRSGVIYGNAAMIDGMIDRIEDELRQPATTIATGGISQFIVPHCRRQVVYDADLLLKGLYLIYQKNR